MIASLMGGQAPDRDSRTSPGDPLVAKRHSYHFCDFSQQIVCFLKKTIRPNETFVDIGSSKQQTGYHD
jgi:hypothetical protein